MNDRNLPMSLKSEFKKMFDYLCNFDSPVQPYAYYALVNAQQRGLLQIKIRVGINTDGYPIRIRAERKNLSYYIEDSFLIPFDYDLYDPYDWNPYKVVELNSMLKERLKLLWFKIGEQLPALEGWPTKEREEYDDLIAYHKKIGNSVPPWDEEFADNSKSNIISARIRVYETIEFDVDDILNIMRDSND